MGKRVFAVLMLVVLVFACQTPAYASPISIKASSTNVQAGNAIIISGTAAGADMWVSIKGVDSSGNIVYFNAVLSDASGNYKDYFKAPDIKGTLALIAGSGADTSAMYVQIISSGESPADDNIEEENADNVSAEKPQIPETGASVGFAAFLISLCALAI